MPVVPASAQTIDRAAALLRDGAVVAFPTETVYGLGASALDAHAAARIFEIKRRPSFDPLIVHVSGETMLEGVVLDIPPAARALMEAFWPGPLTLVLRKRDIIPDLVTSGLPTVAVRMPAHPVARAILEAARVPLAAPSANPFGYLSPTRAEHVARMLGDAVDLIVDGGPSEHGIESTIVMLEPRLVLLRPGAVDAAAIEAIVGPLARELGDDARPLAPGRLPQHYAPATPIEILGTRGAAADCARAGLLAFREPRPGYAAVRVLAPDADLREAATHLFEYLHELDALGLDRIDVELVPARGVGIAINDRLARAAAA